MSRGGKMFRTRDAVVMPDAADVVRYRQVMCVGIIIPWSCALGRLMLINERTKTTTLEGFETR